MICYLREKQPLPRKLCEKCLVNGLLGARGLGREKLSPEDHGRVKEWDPFRRPVPPTSSWRVTGARASVERVSETM